MSWETVIGLEIHAQVASKLKLFSNTPTDFGGEPNMQVALLDIAMPGVLPVLNTFCVEQAVRSGLAIGANVNKYSVFDRKNYFYPDLSAGYQITQFFYPIVSGGSVQITDDSGDIKNISVERIHLEQDAAKIIHDYSHESSHIDFNRAGVALMEIVSGPDMSSSKEAVEYVKNLRMILCYVGSCNGNMEKGCLRCDANVSVRKVGQKKLGTRCEIKNLNSMRYIAQAIDYEVERQIDILEGGGGIEQQTRLFDFKTGKTAKMRQKENADDYSYFPDPDLTPVRISDKYIDIIKSSMPELPQDKIKRYVEVYGLSQYDADVLVADKIVADYFEQVIEENDPIMASKWITTELFGRLNKKSISVVDCPFGVDDFSDFLLLISNKAISGKIAKQVLDMMFDTQKKPGMIVKDMNLEQIVDPVFIAEVVQNVLSNNPKVVQDYNNGKERLFVFFVGQVMKSTKGKANPEIVNKILIEQLSKL